MRYSAFVKFFALAFLLVISCSLKSTRSQSPAGDFQAASSAFDSPIRSVDFRNFTYLLTEDLVDSTNPQRSFSLKNGKLPETRNKQGLVDKIGISLDELKYGDVTGDGQEEAILTMSVLTGGSSVPHIIYVYTLDGSRPKRLWAFTTGDRADRGLRKVYIERGKLTVELNSPDKSQGDCCPLFFTRSKYTWTGERFEVIEHQENLPIL